MITTLFLVVAILQSPEANQTDAEGQRVAALGHYEQAIALHEKAIALRQQVGDVQGLASSLASLGDCFAVLGQYEKAIDAHQRALALSEKIGNTSAIAASLGSLGDCHCHLGQYEKAIDAHQRALALSEKIGNASAIAASLGSLGDCYHALGQSERALPFQQKALALREQIGGNAEAIAASLESLGDIYQSLGQHARAISFQERALALREPAGNPLAIAGSLGQLGESRRQLGQYEEALALHQRALALQEHVGNPHGIAASFRQLGIDYTELAQHGPALDSFAACLAQLAKVSRRSLGEDGRMAFLAAFADLASLASRNVRALLKTQDASSCLQALAHGFSIMQSFAGRTLGEGIQEHASGQRRTSPERVRILEQLEAQRLELERGSSEAEQARLRRQIDEQQSKLVAIDEQLRRQDPRLADLITPAAAPLQDVQQKVLGDDDALLQFVLGEPESFLWVITNADATVLSIAGQAALKESFDRLLAMLATADSPSLALADLARKLYQDLLASAEPLIASKHNLLVVPDGFLGLLPFEVLLTRDGADPSDLEHLPYLVRTKAVRYAPSIALLTLPPRQTSWTKDALLLGDPVIDTQPGAISKTQFSRAPDARLRLRLVTTRDELVAIAQTLLAPTETAIANQLRDLPRSARVSAARFDLDLGNAASDVRLKGNLRDYRIVHLATHGVFDQQFPWSSGVVLSSGESSGFMNLVEIDGLDVAADLVFLAADDTARGLVLRAEGIGSCVRAFLLAGARSVVGSHWQVADAAVPVLAREFYARYFDGTSAAEALRQAKLAVLATSGLAHPFFWAPFVLWTR